jgi:hypothetical protein
MRRVLLPTILTVPYLLVVVRRRASWRPRGARLAGAACTQAALAVSESLQLHTKPLAHVESQWQCVTQCMVP